MKILISGATGFYGPRIVELLKERGHSVNVLTRHPSKAVLKLGGDNKYIQWDASQIPEPSAFEGVDAIIHLAGATISERWTSEQKEKIRRSREEGTQNIIKGINQAGVKPKAFISTSAVGIYGTHDDESLTEESGYGDDFLANVCKAWEGPVKENKDLYDRYAIIRVGVVLGADGGALKKLLTPFKLGVGGPVGSGKQYMSWIHIDDIARLFVEAAENDKYRGIYNGVAPYPVTNEEFSHTLGEVLHRPSFMKAPGFALKLALGEMSTIVLEGQKVLPKRPLKDGFQYNHEHLKPALQSICSK